MTEEEPRSLSTRVFGRSDMTEEEPRSLSTRVFGRPKIWVSCLWLIVGLGLLGTAIIEPSTFRILIAGVWLVVGGGMLVVALKDRAERNRR